MNLDFRAIRLRTRRQQGLDDDLSVDIVDNVVLVTRSRTHSTQVSLVESHPIPTRQVTVNVGDAS